jgi:peptidoglycan/LPS O-acetylase OafA/YrhL
MNYIEMERRTYFRNLNALRFFAAFAVILHHVEQYKYWRNLPGIWGHQTVDALGHKAVSFFFVLSGFLITYLLLEENRRTNTIHVRDFYVRRILRIWPVYYLIVAISLFVVPFVFDLSVFSIKPVEDRFLMKLGLFILILPNLLRTFAPQIVGANQLWSIGVEEQFYLMWPLLIKKFIDRIFYFLLVFIAVKLITTYLLQLFLTFHEYPIVSAFNHIWILFKVEQMAIGAIGAWVLFQNRKKVLAFIYDKVVFIACLLVMASFFFFPLHHWIVSYFEAGVFTIIILNISTNPAFGINLESPLLNRLGNISYGIYMYHTLCIMLCLQTLTYFNLHSGNPVLFNGLLYSSAIFLTMLISNLSYLYFEKPFLSLKERFMVVKSGKGNVEKSALEQLPLKKA